MKHPERTHVLSESGEIIGIMPRAQADAENLLTENALVTVFTTRGQLWLQQRALNKNHYPGLWDISAAGAIQAGETRETAARREQREEMGFESELRYVETFLNEFRLTNGTLRRHHSHVFVGVSDETPQPNEEVIQFVARDPDEVRQEAIARPDQYVPSFLAEFDRGYKGYRALQNGA